MKRHHGENITRILHFTLIIIFFWKRSLKFENLALNFFFVLRKADGRLSIIRPLDCLVSARINLPFVLIVSVTCGRIFSIVFWIIQNLSSMCAFSLCIFLYTRINRLFTVALGSVITLTITLWWILWHHFLLQLCFTLAPSDLVDYAHCI